jgi:SWI/SNF-related matrix-associated actin-dependent regulator of chromatin subfamily B protein 1
MRHSAVDVFTETPTAAPAAGQVIPPNIKFMYLPRIRCHDCPGKLYTPGPGMTVENFEVHLKNRQHREKVDARAARNRGAF